MYRMLPIDACVAIARLATGAATGVALMSCVSGNSIQNVDPRSISLETPSVPLMASASPRDSASPRPVPCTPVASAPNRSKGVKSSLSFSAGMPPPVSVTLRRSRLPSTASVVTITWPDARLYFTAFESRFRST